MRPVDAEAAGYDALAAEFVARRDASRIGADFVREWAAGLPPAAAVLDLGCGTGDPITRVLVDAGLRVHAVDASPALVAVFRERFPDVPVACEPAQESDFFGRSFDGVVAWGLMFLLSPEDQAALIARVARALAPGGRFLFTAPWQVFEWTDVLTGRTSISLGRERYRSLLEGAGLVVEGEGDDEAGNHYWLARGPGG